VQSKKKVVFVGLKLEKEILVMEIGDLSDGKDWNRGKSSKEGGKTEFKHKIAATQSHKPLVLHGVPARRRRVERNPLCGGGTFPEKENWTGDALEIGNGLRYKIENWHPKWEGKRKCY